MFHLWSLAEQDLLSETVSYRPCVNGQGLNRVQAAPKTSRMMHAILTRAQKSLGGWIGSSVIHMDDHTCPTRSCFIESFVARTRITDKHPQIYRILLSIYNTLSQLPALRACIDAEYRSLDVLYLGDFFWHAFDGNGADNFYDAGSCIDGRFTSAWN
ncbi:hypothetical protein F5148DRAFT_1243936 [Russula earlei]|uniref:Uncharacterized protein n=1 Tax=Russula earlei TaxID=71964 RepID=A0ACC0TUW8_9AGAM|nr:hypothetical protein F5148DRAFT_1243936 [Russula earlei]